jgi:hypothetical protein
VERPSQRGKQASKKKRKQNKKKFPDENKERRLRSLKASKKKTEVAAETKKRDFERSLNTKASNHPF